MLRQAVIVIATAMAFKAFLTFYFGEFNPAPAEPTLTTPSPVAPDAATSALPSTAARIFTPQSLRDQCTDTQLYLAILGSVYDVSAGAKHYNSGGSYSFFTGVDASRAYVTGDFKNDLNDRVDDLTDAQIADVFNWKAFYDKTYTLVGVLQGRFYDESGARTSYLDQLSTALERQKQVEHSKAMFHNRFPTCNSEWTQEKGLVRVWCTNESGGVKRAWEGFPRLVFNPTSKTESCACVNTDDLNHPSVKQYSNCEPTSTVCHP